MSWEAPIAWGEEQIPAEGGPSIPVRPWHHWKEESEPDKLGPDPDELPTGRALRDVLLACGVPSAYARGALLGTVNFRALTLRVPSGQIRFPLERSAELAARLTEHFLACGDPAAAAKVRAAYDKTLITPKPATTPAPQQESIAMASTIPDSAAPKTISRRLKDAVREGAKRAPVELALEKGQALLVKQLLAGFRGSRTDKAAVRKFLLWFFSTPAGQVAIAGAISAGAPLVADFVGKGGTTAQAVADEFAARAATIATREGTKFALKHLQPAMSLFAGLFEAMTPAPTLDEGKGEAAQDLGLQRERERVART